MTSALYSWQVNICCIKLNYQTLAVVCEENTTSSLDLFRGVKISFVVIRFLVLLGYFTSLKFRKKVRIHSS